MPTEVPVMVLSNATLFPKTMLPLRIFEPRYRTMLQWCLERERMFCIALTKPGVTDARTPDDFHHVAGLGLVRACVGQADGTANLVLQGLTRVRLSKFLQDLPFRIARATELRTQEHDSTATEALTAKAIELCGEAQKSGSPLPDGIEDQLSKISEPGVVADIIAQTLLRDPQRRQAVLEELDVDERLRLLIAHAKAEQQ